MSEQIKNVGIILKPKAIHDFMTILPNLTEWLRRRKIEIFFAVDETQRLHEIYQTTKIKFNLVTKNEMHSLCQLLVTLGGDGTLIGVARTSKKNSPPIFGINMGNLGFITEFSKHEFHDDLAQVLKGNFETHNVPLYKAEILQQDKVVRSGYFVNDAVISKSGISRMFSISLDTELENIYNLAGDGLIVSSPIGSTAYSLAAGGPIVHPGVKGIILNPICPHALTHRPLVLPDTESIYIKIPKGEDEIFLTLDGQEAITVMKNQKIRISKPSRKHVSLVNNKERLYFKTLKDKFRHGRR
ncbi:MAG: hypothetical protein BM556_09455 [Bacteriovorax sp. MedPE-SWde]|nr:MAG: hypothetical protein BM556_09455 [Bacteriovorax sp. MedPE-SWde]